MSESANPSTEKTPEKEEALIFTPISIARARHASAHTPSVIEKAQSKQQSSQTQSDSGVSSGGTSFINQTNGCLWLIIFIGAIIAAGFVGGLMGGSLMLWANSSGVLALTEDNPDPISVVLPSPTLTPVATLTPNPSPSPEPTRSIEEVLAQIIPSVVTVINQHPQNLSTLDEGRVVGSGIIIDLRGYVATNNHVVDTPQSLHVILADGREVTAQLVAANPAEDLAILKIDPVDLPIIEWGNSKDVRPGQIVYAIGSPLGDFPSSVSFGIVSGLNRALEIDKYVIDGLIQTDAAINRGSSGGPLINLQGQIIGINTFIIRESEERGIAEGIAFAIPAETAKNLLIPWIAAHTGESVPIPASEESN